MARIESRICDVVDHGDSYVRGEEQSRKIVTGTVTSTLADLAETTKNFEPILLLVL